MADHSMKVGDTLPEITATLKDGNGNPVNIYQADVAFVMRSFDGTVALEAPADNLDDNAEENTGKVVYYWAPGDTDVPGGYWLEWFVTFNGMSGDEFETFPNDGWKTLAIIGNLREPVAS